MRKTRPALFRGRHFQDHVIVLCVRWYLRYCLTLRYLEEMMVERSLNVDGHAAYPQAIRELKASRELSRRARGCGTASSNHHQPVHGALCGGGNTAAAASSSV
jgi:transposase-like protein